MALEQLRQAELDTEAAYIAAVKVADALAANNENFDAACAAYARVSDLLTIAADASRAYDKAFAQTQWPA